MEGTEAIIYQLRSSFEAMDNNFNSMKMRIDELETNLTETVVQAKDKIVSKLENMQIQTQVSNHDQLNQEKNEIIGFNSKIKELEADNKQKGEKIAQLKQNLGE